MRDVNADMAKMNEIIAQASVGADLLVESVLVQAPGLVSEAGKALLVEALYEAIRSTATGLYVKARVGK